MATGLPPSTAAFEASQEDSERLRFQAELEFVQCLSSPHYLNCGYLKEAEFVNYLDYLQYWKKQEYAKFLKYPQCLHFLDLIQSEFFRRELVYSQCSKFIDEQQLQHWHMYTRKRSQFQQKILSKGKQAPVEK